MYATADEGCIKGARDTKLQSCLATRVSICGLISVITHVGTRSEEYKRRFQDASSAK